MRIDRFILTSKIANKRDKNLTSNSNDRRDSRHVFTSKPSRFQKFTFATWFESHPGEFVFQFYNKQSIIRVRSLRFRSLRNYLRNCRNRTRSFSEKRETGFYRYMMLQIYIILFYHFQIEFFV